MKVPVKQPRRDVALDALRETIFEFGKTLPETSTIPHGVKGVKLEQWRERWTLRTGYDDSKSESVRVNFTKDVRTLANAGTIGVSTPFCWINHVSGTRTAYRTALYRWWYADQCEGGSRNL